MTPSIVKLGEFIFQGFEIPSSMPFGGTQSLSVKKLPGGSRIIDAMGRDDAPLQWSGVFTTPDSVSRAKFLDSYRIAGTEQTLTWGAFSYQVVVHEFHPDYQRDNYVPYRIICEIVQDNITAAVQSVTNDLDTETAAVFDAITTAASNLVQTEAEAIWPGAVGFTPYKNTVSLASLIGSIKNGIASLQGIYTAAMQGVVSIVNLEMSIISGIQNAIDTVQEDIAGATALVENAINGFSGLFGTAPIVGYGGVDTGAAAVGVILQSSDALVNYSNLLLLGSNLTVLNRNLGYINGYPNAKTVTVLGGNLSKIALDEYGDASMWPLIAKANRITDPVIYGQMSLIIPPNPNTAANIPGGADIDHWMGGDINLGNQNDLGTVLAEVKAQQRILRRLLTNQGSYKWHTGYGAGILQQIGQTEANLGFIEGIVIAQVQMEQGVLQTPAPTVTFATDNLGMITANIAYSYANADSRQFLSFTVEP